jgi:hypothetical protein
MPQFDRLARAKGRDNGLAENGSKITILKTQFLHR